MAAKTSSKRGRAKAAPETETKDTSPYVPQREKITTDIFIRELPWTPNQQEFLDIALDKSTRLMLVKGEAGTAKTLLSTYASLQWLKRKAISDVVYLRSAVEVGESMGHLPGDADEKMALYNQPFWEKANELLNGPGRKYLTEDQRIHCMPINFIRGLNWNAKAIILDEAQNSTRKELKTALTRLGKFTHTFICADPEQTDLKNGNRGGFDEIFNRFEHHPEAKEDFGIHTFELKDNMRSDLVRFICKELKTLGS